MKRNVIADLVRRGSIPWVTQLPETRSCFRTVRDKHLRTSAACSLRAGWMFTAGPDSTIPGGPYCWAHLMMILATGWEQARIEDLLKAQRTV